MLSSRTARSKGFVRYATAPAFRTRSRSALFGNAVMKMTGMSIPEFTRCLRRSGPLIPGIRTSAMRQYAFRGHSDPRNASAESKVSFVSEGFHETTRRRANHVVIIHNRNYKSPVHRGASPMYRVYDRAECASIAFLGSAVN